MASPGAIITHGSTPTGFGIRQRSNGALRATSPCCGRTLTEVAGIVTCNGCTNNFNPAYAGGALLSGDVSPNNSNVHSWVSNVTGYSDVTVSML